MTADELLVQPARLAALRSVAILDTPRERDFDDLCALAAFVCDAPVAIVNFIAEDRQWFKSEIGLGCEAPPLNVSICRHSLGRDYVELGDLSQDERFAANPLISGKPYLRLYAGISLKVEEQPVGTICVLDYKSRELSEAQRKGLRTIATQVTALLELRQNVKRQKDSSAAKDEFLAKLSHELRTPLTPVLMTVSDLLESGVGDARLRDDLAMILRNVQLEARLIDDLLDVTRIANGKLVLKTEAVDLHALLEYAIGVCAAQLQERKIVPLVALKAERHWVEGDSARLQQVFWNLLTNAAKFTPEQGLIEIRSANMGERIRVSVRDEGRGIEREQLESLFDIFEQGDRETTKTHGGLGLGLAICKGVVEMHAGEIRAESKGAGSGATFTVDLTTTAKPLKGSLATTPTLKARPLRILLVEDHLTTGEVLERLMKRSGHLVCHVASMAAAQEAANSQPFDLVISDLGLPDGSGLDLMRGFRERHGLRGVALSGYGSPADIVASQEAGFVRHLLKPVDWKMLCATLEQVQSEWAS